MAKAIAAKRMSIAVKVVLILVAVWLVGDFLYSRIVAYQISRWEATIDRDAEGVIAGCDAFTVAASDAAPDRGALLLVHGINASPYHYAKMAPALAELGFTCHAMRLPGFAEPIPRYAESTRVAWKDAIGVQLERLRQEHEQVGVVAHSLGGAATIGHLLDQPASADFAVLLAPAIAVSSNRSPVLATRTWHEIGRWTLFSTTIMQFPFDIDSHDPANADYPGRSPFAPRRVVDELFALMDENESRLIEFRTPLLLVLTEADQVVDPEAAKRFYESVASSEKELVMLEDSGHAITIDYGWQNTVVTINRFATQHARGE